MSIVVTLLEGNYYKLVYYTLIYYLLLSLDPCRCWRRHIISKEAWRMEEYDRGRVVCGGIHSK
jgi:hypothetical protein